MTHSYFPTCSVYQVIIIVVHFFRLDLHFGVYVNAFHWLGILGACCVFYFQYRWIIRFEILSSGFSCLHPHHIRTSLRLSAICSKPSQVGQSRGLRTYVPYLHMSVHFSVRPARIFCVGFIYFILLVLFQRRQLVLSTDCRICVVD